MTDRPGSARVDLAALRRFVERMGRHLTDLSGQLSALNALQHRQLPLGETAIAKEQALRHQRVCEAYQQELAQLMEAYENAIELTEVLLRRYGDTDQATREVIESSYGRLEAATRMLGD
ncbi:hypothetical protein Vqi01_42580 [Micromonospora qiuiae]|uniref:PE domain-containing protein n=1 Tax=Micromonospora qiuiae TaxID=502268 RepID=A0ABQ4JHW5_9ACTN|nr:hypothetical protein [Micromonospora qiuiae]GIJ29096.1 hypothetical protein Vqi01_42580 [Micromonospora qiuiae]